MFLPKYTDYTVNIPTWEYTRLFPMMIITLICHIQDQNISSPIVSLDGEGDQTYSLRSVQSKIKLFKKTHIAYRYVSSGHTLKFGGFPRRTETEKALCKSKWVPVKIEWVPTRIFGPKLGDLNLVYSLGNLRVFLIPLETRGCANYNGIYGKTISAEEILLKEFSLKDFLFRQSCRVLRG